MPKDKIEQLQAWEKANNRRSPKLASRPRLPPYLTMYVNAFFDLSNRRQFSMAELPLTVGAIIKYGKLFGYRSELRFFFKMMAGMDNEFLLFHGERRKAETPSKQKDSAPRSDGL